MTSSLDTAPRPFSPAGCFLSGTGSNRDNSLVVGSRIFTGLVDFSGAG